MKSQSRRNFLQFLGGSLAASTLGLNTACTTDGLGFFKSKDVKSLKPGLNKDDLTLAEGFSYNILIKEGEPLTQDLLFGTNNDFTQFVNLKNNKTGLWVNHESFTCTLASGRYRTETPSKEQFHKERKMLGGSFFEIKKTDKNKWAVVKDSPYNTRLSGESKIPFSNNEKIANSDYAIGTFANCSGGLTPWNTILTCEENYQHYYGEYDRSIKAKNKTVVNEKSVQWHKHEALDPRHYGWVVEFDPETQKSKKLIGLGRFSHECAKTVLNHDGRTIAYSGDDTDNECLYKFVASEKGSLDKGELFVASLEQKKWLSLDINKSTILKKNFKNQTEVLTFCREAAKLLGATPLARPEDIEIDPINGHVLIALTNNKTTNDYFGSILKIIEPNIDSKTDYASETFEYETFLTGGPKSGMACPDNLVFDKAGNLWITTDISGSAMNKGLYKIFGNNGLFVVPRRGKNAGLPIQIASAPYEAEFTGPCFSPDGNTLFLSVQHPGELSPKQGAYTSHWPEGGTSAKPLSAVVTITGPFSEI
jgi:uncharacterized protein